MKKIKKKSLVLFLTLIFMVMAALPVGASQATSYTYTLDDQNEMVRTQDAYLPDKTITDLGLSEPSDMVIDENNIAYIVDTGNQRIVVYDLNTEKVVKEMKKGTINSDEFTGFETPKGIFRTNEGELYIADSGAKTVFRFTKDFEFVRRYDKPTAPIFADTNYEPSKVAVDSGNNLYIVSEGVYAGIIQLANTGEFLGYFTSNKSVLTPQQMFLKLIYTKEQQKKSEILNTLPSTFSNVYVDRQGTAYSTCMGKGNDLLKKHSTNGTNMFGDVKTPSALTDVTTDENGIIYACDSHGYVWVYTSQGEVIFEFGEQAEDTDISGLYSSLMTIAVDNKGNIWTADSEKGILQSFNPTEYATTIYRALDEYENGDYDDALTDWNYVLRLNQMSVLAHNGVAKAYYNDEEYDKAMEHFEIAGNRDGYSNAFWEVRNKAIQKGLGTFLIIVIVLILLKVVISLVDRDKKIRKAKRALGKKLKNTPVIGEIGYAFKCAKHPIDRYYDIRVHKNGSMIAATIIYIVFFGVYMLYQTQKGFIYQYTKVEDMDMGAVVVGFFAILILFIVCNFLVTSITDGDGTLKQVYMIPAYGVMPAMISMLVTIGMSYVLTYNESFILTTIMAIGVCWSIATIFEGLATVHDYDFKHTVLSLIITVVFMLIAAIVVLVVIIMWEQLKDFLLTVGKEIIRNVTGS
ncbi:YIP1 family protein [uncultured Eubacterium sp.]|uniref:YIP1 family protein n=1 Tax=uncultured Eubacterium sp. TaxID=165185 RepID=UPI0026071EDF|nr:YIP1 family protein [uncultured Eubacterium sp.]